jgi:23S rRNA pseudouridine1911/1915/1917 synthase
VIPPDAQPGRADAVLACVLPGETSRSAAARLIRSGRVLVNGRPIKSSNIINPGDAIDVLPPEEEDPGPIDQPLPRFRIVFEDDQIIVVDKPPGLVVHPGPGRPSGTLMDALLSSRPEMIGVGEPDRWGIVHRLDRDTSGVMVAAKTAAAHARLSTMFKEHSIRKVYLALVRGNPHLEEGVITAALGRHAHDRKRISTATQRPRAAVTKWKALARYGGLTLLEVTPETGRTHQIRVHLAYAGLPVAGDKVYGRVRKKTATADPMLTSALAGLQRQALHAALLGFQHPSTSQYVQFESPLPQDMRAAICICETRVNR